MEGPYNNTQREKKRITFAKKRHKGNSIVSCCEAAGIAPSTYYAWNSNDDWSKDDGWSKDDNDSTDDTWSK